MPIERAADHPTFELSGNTITSLASPARGSKETALFRTDVPPGGDLPPHHHDHFDVFTIVAGSCTFYIGDEIDQLSVGDSAVVPIGARHYVEAGSDGTSMVVVMFGGTKLIRDDGSEIVPEWVR